MASTRDTKNTPREEDYRDYESRNIEDGWPYADAAGASSRPVGNGAYGTSKANFDRERNRGYHVDNVDAQGRQDRLQDNPYPGTEGLEDMDDLEERSSNAIDNIEDVSMAAIDLHAADGVVTIEGSVDEVSQSRQIKTVVENVSGVRHVINNLRVTGVDATIARDG